MPESKENCTPQSVVIPFSRNSVFASKTKVSLTGSLHIGFWMREILPPVVIFERLCVSFQFNVLNGDEADDENYNGAVQN